MSSSSSTVAGHYKKNSSNKNKHADSSSTSNLGDSIEEGTSRAASGRPACAACKHQRRKCTANCLLAPYFPAHLQRQFVNAHHLYGVKNITRIVRGLDPVLRDTAMYSIIYESNARASDRVGGCLGIVRELERRLQRETSELALVLQQLAVCRAQTAAQASTSALASSTSVVPGDDGDLVVDMGNGDIDNGHQDVTLTSLQQQQQQQCYGYFYDGDQDANNNVNNNHNTTTTTTNSIDRNNISINNCNDNIKNGERDRGVVLKMQEQVEMQTLNLRQHQQQGGEEELEYGNYMDHDTFDVIRQPFHDERGSSDHADAATAESCPCRLGLGMA